MEKGESKNENQSNAKIDNKFRRSAIKRHSSLRAALCDNKETQLKNLAKLDINAIKRHSVILGQSSNLLNLGIFNFEKEEADEDDDANDSDIEEEKNNENDTNEKNPIDAFKEKQRQEKEKQKNEKSEKEETEKKEENNEEDDEMPDYFDPLNEKGELRIPLKTKNKYKKDDFDVIALSGKGAYGTVLKVKFKNDTSNKFYAIKVMDVSALDRIKKLYQAYLECDILSQLDNPYIVDILGAFDDNRKIYIVMQYLSKGDFSDFIRLNYPLKLDTIQFYAAEIVNFLDYLQSKKLVHRDLKPENIMMNENWHLQVIDFATARVLGKYFDKKKMIFKIDDSYYDISETDDLKGNKIAINEEDEDDLDDMKRPERRGMTFVGTAEYVSPEVLGDKPAGFGSDIWALGIMIYQMFYGKTPFKEKTNYLIFRKIEQLKIDFNPNIKIPEEAKDLINKILVKDPTKRLGAGEAGSEYDIKHLKNHPFFKGIDWENLHNMVPPNSDKFDYLMSKKSNTGNLSSSVNTSLKQTNSSDLGIAKNKSSDEINNNNGNDDQAVVLRKGYLEKKSPWLHYNKRKIILYSTPKLVYIDPSNNKIKGEIYLDKKFKVNHISMNIFDLISPKRSFRFKSCDGDVLVWEKSITEAIKQYAK
jgi:serine/threonine protein kinase